MAFTEAGNIMQFRFFSIVNTKNHLVHDVDYQLYFKNQFSFHTSVDHAEMYHIQPKHILNYTKCNPYLLLCQKDSAIHLF